MQIDRYGQSYVVSATTMFIYRGLSFVGGHRQINKHLYNIIYARARAREGNFNYQLSIKLVLPLCYRFRHFFNSLTMVWLMTSQ